MRLWECQTADSFTDSRHGLDIRRLVLVVLVLLNSPWWTCSRKQSVGCISIRKIILRDKHLCLKWADKLADNLTSHFGPDKYFSQVQQHHEQKSDLMTHSLVNVCSTSEVTCKNICNILKMHSNCKEDQNWESLFLWGVIGTVCSQDVWIPICTDGSLVFLI